MIMCLDISAGFHYGAIVMMPIEKTETALSFKNTVYIVVCPLEHAEIDKQTKKTNKAHAHRYRARVGTNQTHHGKVSHVFWGDILV